jgi:hypothetical protein
MSSEEKDAQLEEFTLKLAEAVGLMKRMSTAINEGRDDFKEWYRERETKKAARALIEIHAKLGAFENDIANELEPYLIYREARDLLWGKS